MKLKKIISIFLFIILSILIILFFVLKKEYPSLVSLATIRSFILSFGVWGPIITMLMVTVQTVIMVIPDFITIIASSAIFGWVYTALIAWIGSLLGATICFYIGRLLGRDFIIKLSNKSMISKIDNFFNKYGRYSILIARLIPFIPFDLTSYFAGVTALSIGEFLIATALGELPATILYSYLGGVLTDDVEHLFIGISIIVVIILIISIYKFTLNKRRRA